MIKQEFFLLQGGVCPRCNGDIQIFDLLYKGMCTPCYIDAWNHWPRPVQRYQAEKFLKILRKRDKERFNGKCWKASKHAGSLYKRIQQMSNAERYLIIRKARKRNVQKQR